MKFIYLYRNLFAEICFIFLLSISTFKSFCSEAAIADLISVQEQDPEKMITIDGKKYIVYNVKQGDTWYGLAKKFKMTYSELRMANKHSDDKLIIGKEVLVPVEKLKANDPFYEKNYIDEKIETKNGEPIYHIVEKSQTLYSISKIYKISVDDIKGWNNLKSNEISIGQKLIVSKVKTKKNTSSMPKPNKEKETKVDIETSKAENKIVPPTENDKQKSNSEKPKSEEYSPRDNNVKSNRVDKFEKQNTSEVISPSNAGKVVFANNRRKIEEDGYASWISLEENGDEKYYALHRKAPIGTIIKVVNVSNSRQIYVKVTGQLPDTFETDGIIINISKSSAEKLEVKDKKFRVELLYGLDKE